MAKDLIRNELPKILSSFGVDTSLNTSVSNVTSTQPANQTGVRESANKQVTTAGTEPNIPVKDTKTTNTISDIILMNRNGRRIRGWLCG